MQVEIVCIGDEVLQGFTVNRNAAFLSLELGQRSYDVVRHTVLPDRPKDLEKGLKEALERSKLVITTGGLGPTVDDRTRPIAEKLMGSKGEKLKNAVGHAPGVYFSSDESHLVLLPGVPTEMKRMFLEEALPHLEKNLPVKKRERAACSLCLLKEIEVDPDLRELEKKYPEIEMGIYPSLGTLRIVFRGERAETALTELKEKYKTYWFEQETIAEAVHAELIAREKTLALAESCTGGAIAQRLTAIPDASLYLLGSIVSYSNAFKQHFLNVSKETLEKHGAVSRETVIEMVEGLFAESKADFAIAVSGIAGPTGGTKKKPVGTVYFAIAERNYPIDAGLLLAPPNRASAIEFSVQHALCALWRHMVYGIDLFPHR